jgi:hypothetical protein
MQLRHFFYTQVVAALLLASTAIAQQSQSGATESGWLELVKGAHESQLGTQLVNIEDNDAADTRSITLAIPKKSLANRDNIEEVVVVGQQPEHPEWTIPIKFSYEWVNDYDSENYGLVVHLGKDSNLPIRLYMNSDPNSTH